MPQATVNPSGAAAPFDPSTAIAHFQFIEDASAFIQGKHAVVPRAHAVAFFASEREPESRIYERVAENLAELAHAPALPCSRRAFAPPPAQTRDLADMSSPGSRRQSASLCLRHRQAPPQAPT